jgi:hypothetical protein
MKSFTSDVDHQQKGSKASTYHPSPDRISMISFTLDRITNEREVWLASTILLPIEFQLNISLLTWITNESEVWLASTILLPIEFQ